MSVRLPQNVLQGQRGAGAGGEATFLGGALPARAVVGSSPLARVAEWPQSPWQAACALTSPFALQAPAGEAEELASAEACGLTGADVKRLREQLNAAAAPHARLLLAMAVAGLVPLAAGVALLLVWGKLVSIALVAALLPGWALYARVEGRYKAAYERVLTRWLEDELRQRGACALILWSGRLRRPGERRGIRSGDYVSAQERAKASRPCVALFRLDQGYAAAGTAGAAAAAGTAVSGGGEGGRAAEDAPLLPV